MADEVDLVILTRNASPLRADVQRGIAHQKRVSLNVHRMIGEVLPTDANRWETISRARNQGKLLGTAPYLFFLDDDVVLSENAVGRLLAELQRRPVLAAIAADYLQESRIGQRADHVAMGATLFRRSALDRFNFRWEADRCECQCICDDLRRAGMQIAYSRRVRALHLGNGASHHADPGAHESSCVRTGTLALSDSPIGGSTADAIVMVAFDHRQYRGFRDQFLPTLRSHGNHETVIVFGYGLYPSQHRECARLRNVEFHALRAEPGMSPAKLRLRDFQLVARELAPGTPLAYWDAADVVFQSSLEPLWQEVRQYPAQLHAACEVLHYANNPGVLDWVQTIASSTHRQHALNLLAVCDCINSGFVAGTACAMQAYFVQADQFLRSAVLAGSSDWGDQTALNLYCRSYPQRWRQVSAAWNYCLCGRDLPRHRFNRSGRLECQCEDIRVVHGNAKTLPHISGYRTFQQNLRRISVTRELTTR
jgi:hypothetical protein